MLIIGVLKFLTCKNKCTSQPPILNLAASNTDNISKLPSSSSVAAFTFLPAKNKFSCVYVNQNIYPGQSIISHTQTTEHFFTQDVNRRIYTQQEYFEAGIRMCGCALLAVYFAAFISDFICSFLHHFPFSDPQRADNYFIICFSVSFYPVALRSPAPSHFATKIWGHIPGNYPASPLRYAPLFFIVTRSQHFFRCRLVLNYAYTRCST